MAADIGGVDMAERDHEPRARTADGLRRRNDRLGLTEHLAHALAAGLVPDRAVLELAVLADDDALAIGFDLRGAAELRDQPRCELAPELAQGCLKRHQIRLIAAREGIADHRNGGPDQQRLLPPGTALVPDGLDAERGLADVMGHVLGQHALYASSTTGLRSTPIFSISTSTTSPGLRKTGGLRVKP